MTESEKCKECIEFAWEGGWMGWKKPTIRYDIVFDQKDDFIYLYTNPRYDERVAAECFFFSHDFIRCALKGAGLDPGKMVCSACGIARPICDDCRGDNSPIWSGQPALFYLICALACKSHNAERLNFLHETLTKKGEER